MKRSLSVIRVQTGNGKRDNTRSMRHEFGKKTMMVEEIINDKICTECLRFARKCDNFDEETVLSFIEKIEERLNSGEEVKYERIENMILALEYIAINKESSTAIFGKIVGILVRWVRGKHEDISNMAIDTINNLLNSTETSIHCKKMIENILL